MGLKGTQAEGDSMSIDGPLVHANPWDLADEAEEVLELARRLNISFTHIKQSTKPR